jgi:NADH-quinone oxidoreductase subunit E
MSVRRLDPVQPKSFKFSAQNARWAKAEIKKYPKGKQASAVIPLLWRAQVQHGGWLPEPAIRIVADMLDMAEIRVLEVATFYTMFNLSPVGKYFVQLCGTTPCWLKGADGLEDVCRRVIGEQNKVTEDGIFSWLEVECLGACANAPMVQINKDYYEDLTPASLEKILNDLSEGRAVPPGPQNGRQFSAPVGGPTTLLNTSNKRTGHSSFPNRRHTKDPEPLVASRSKTEKTRQPKSKKEAQTAREAVKKDQKGKA